jgi:hypothetical protein
MRCHGFPARKSLKGKKAELESRVHAGRTGVGIFTRQSGADALARTRVSPSSDKAASPEFYSCGETSIEASTMTTQPTRTQIIPYIFYRDVEVPLD